MARATSMRLRRRSTFGAFTPLERYHTTAPRGVLCRASARGQGPRRGRLLLFSGIVSDYQKHFFEISPRCGETITRPFASDRRRYPLYILRNGSRSEAATSASRDRYLSLYLLCNPPTLSEARRNLIFDLATTKREPSPRRTRFRPRWERSAARPPRGWYRMARSNANEAAKRVNPRIGIARVHESYQRRARR